MSASPTTQAPQLVLVEGRSDAAVVRALLAREGHGSDAVAVVPLHGITNIENQLATLEQTGSAATVSGLCDAAEAHFVVRALRRRGHDVEGPHHLATHGYFVCEADLEDELIRALGPDVVEAALGGVGLATPFRTFRNQPEWRDRGLHAQLRRFAGAGSGRKELLAAALAQLLTHDNTPPPLSGLLTHLASRSSVS